MKMEKESNIYSAFENNKARVRMGRKELRFCLVVVVVVMDFNIFF